MKRSSNLRVLLVACIMCFGLLIFSSAQAQLVMPPAFSSVMYFTPPVPGTTTPTSFSGLGTPTWGGLGYFGTMPTIPSFGGWAGTPSVPGLSGWFGKATIGSPLSIGTPGVMTFAPPVPGSLASALMPFLPSTAGLMTASPLAMPFLGAGLAGFSPIMPFVPPLPVAPVLATTPIITPTAILPPPTAILPPPTAILPPPTALIAPTAIAPPVIIPPTALIAPTAIVPSVVVPSVIAPSVIAPTALVL